GISEPILRFGVFAGVLAAMAALELVIPKRDLGAPKLRRWVTNLSIVALGFAAVRLLGLLAGPLVAVGAALLAESRGWGLLNALAWPAWIEVVLALVVLDFAIWLQHLVSHKVPLLWRLHR